MNLKEAKRELWTKWNRKGEYKIKQKEEETMKELERKLNKIEKVAKEYEEILEKEMIEIQDKAETKYRRLEKKNKKEQHYEMLRLTVQFIEDHKEQWEADRKQNRNAESEEQEMREWKNLTKEEKINKMKQEENPQNSTQPEQIKEERYKIAMKDRTKWMEWRSSEKEPENQETEHENEQPKIDEEQGTSNSKPENRGEGGKPGCSNTSPQPKIPLAKLREGELGGEGGNHEIHQ